MAKSFEFAIAEDTDAAAVLARARDEARKSGIVMEGDASEGRFRGTAEGTYRVDGANLQVEVTNKPGFVPWKMVESALRKVFS